MKDGLDFWCKDCKKKANYKHKKRYPKYERRWRDKTQYGLSEEESDLVQKIRENGSCYLCGLKDKKSLHIDHDHVTGEIRGILCDKCNRGLGLFKDDANLIKKAFLYLGSPPGIDFGDII